MTNPRSDSDQLGAETCTVDVVIIISVDVVIIVSVDVLL